MLYHTLDFWDFSNLTTRTYSNVSGLTIGDAVECHKSVQSQFQRSDSVAVAIGPFHSVTLFYVQYF